MCNCNEAIKWKTFAVAILKKLLLVGSTIINIAAQLAQCNIEFFLARLKLPLLISLPTNKTTPPFSLET